jgi:hypothetical protein
MTTFLDARLDAQRWKLAGQLGIAVVTREHRSFQFKADSVYQALQRVSKAIKADGLRL